MVFRNEKNVKLSEENNFSAQNKEIASQKYLKAN